MQNDLDFGTSVWETPSEPALLPDTSVAAAIKPPADETFDAFNVFAESTDDGVLPDLDDEFGDFEDFGGGQIVDAADFGEDAAFGEEVRIPAAKTADWEPLRLDPMPTRSELHKQVNDILEIIWPDDDVSQVTTDEGTSEVEGISRILVTPESRELWKTLTQPLPHVKPPNWTRSRIRREHLIALGIPVNLDEVLPHSNGKPLPPLQISTRPMSAPPGPRQGSNHPEPPHTGSSARSPAIIGKQGTPPSHLDLASKPELHEQKIAELLNLDIENLSLLPLATLEGHISDLRAQITNTSNVLTHLLQVREALQQDSETYNGLIAELVSEAQKMKSAKGRQVGRG